MSLGLGINRKLHRLQREARYLYRNTLGRPRLFHWGSPERLGVVYRQPSDMCVTDKIMIYALVRGLRPRRILEIGSKHGGSAMIMSSALQDAGGGGELIVGLDPNPQLFRPRIGPFFGRFQRVEGYSPQDVPQALAKLGGQADFIFIDAVHTHDAVLRDARATLPYLTPGGHVLLHDAFHQGISQAAQTLLAEDAGLVDCGILTRSPVLCEPVIHQGLRLLRRGPVDDRGLISDAFRTAGRPEARFDQDVWNCDPYG